MGGRPVSAQRCVAKDLQLMRTPDIGIANWFLPRALCAPGRTALAFAFATAIAASLWSPAVSDELRPVKYKVTLMVQVRHEIIVEAHEELAARTVALLEMCRTSGWPNPAWNPSPRSVLAHVHGADEFAVIDIEPLAPAATPRRPIPPKADDDGREQIGSAYGPNTQRLPTR
jgi:hypothetical protein